MKHKVYVNLRYVFLAATLTLAVGCDSGSSNSGTPVVTSAAPTPAPSPAPISTPDPGTAIDTTVNSSASESTIQTDLSAASSRQESTSLNYNVESVVETTLPIQMTSEQYEAVSSLHLVFKSG